MGFRVGVEGPGAGRTSGLYGFGLASGLVIFLSCKIDCPKEPMGMGVYLSGVYITLIYYNILSYTIIYYNLLDYSLL